MPRLTIVTACRAITGAGSLPAMGPNRRAQERERAAARASVEAKRAAAARRATMIEPMKCAMTALLLSITPVLGEPPNQPGRPNQPTPVDPAFDQLMKEFEACDEAEAKRWTLVKTSEVELRNVTLAPVVDSKDPEANTLVAALKNKSSKRVTDIKLAFTSFDCADAKTSTDKCDVIGRKAYTLTIDVPPGEVHRLDTVVWTPAVPPLSVCLCGSWL
jgi:hypothetical protein